MSRRWILLGWMGAWALAAPGIARAQLDDEEYAQPARHGSPSSQPPDAPSTSHKRHKHRKHPDAPPPDDGLGEAPPSPPAAHSSEGADDGLDLESTKPNAGDDFQHEEPPPTHSKRRKKKRPEPPADEAPPKKAPASPTPEPEPAAAKPAEDEGAHDEQLATPAHGKHASDEAPSDTAPQGDHSHAGDDVTDESPAPRKRQPAADSDSDTTAEAPTGDTGYTAAWSAITGDGVGTNQHLLWAELGAPGLSALYLQGRSPTLDMGGGLQLDFPPFNGTNQAGWRGPSSIEIRVPCGRARVSSQP